MFNFADFANISLGWKWRYPNMGRVKSVTWLSCAPALGYIASWWPSTSGRNYSHLTACSLIFLVLLVSPTIYHGVTRVSFAVAALAGLQCNHWSLRYCCVPAGGASVDTPVVQLDSDPLSHGSGVHGAMSCCCAKGEEDNNEDKCEVLRNILLASSQNGMSVSQLACSTHDEDNCV